MDKEASEIKPMPQPAEETSKQGQPAARPGTERFGLGSLPADVVKPGYDPSADFPEAMAETEEAEEVLVVEPLELSDLSSPEQQSPSTNDLDFLSENSAEQGFPEQEKGGDLFDPGPKEQETQLGDIFAISGGSESGGEPEAVLDTAEISEKQGDDFTTDTLAELYISQGFFEKAVDIYERMLVDNPSSQGLKDKLANVKAMAQRADGGAEEPHEEASSSHVPEEFPAESGLFETQSSAVPGGFDDFISGQAGERSAESTLFEASFDPVEYVPPDAIPRTPAPNAEAAGLDETAEADMTRERKASLPGTAAGGDRQEQINRLELWLHNVMKIKER